jgi:hypothetical protein
VFFGGGLWQRWLPWRKQPKQGEPNVASELNQDIGTDSPHLENAEIESDSADRAAAIEEEEERREHRAESAEGE